VSLPCFDTPLAERVELPPAPARERRFAPALAAALISAPGQEDLRARLLAPGALVVTTGQQPGLFTGPALAVSKALSARAVAGLLEKRLRRPVVPLYWVPGDDHDLHEVATAFWLDQDGARVSAALATRAADAPMLPMWRQPLGPEVEPALDRFAGSFADAGAAPIVDLLRRHYRPDQSVAGAFGATLAELLAPLGVLCLDSCHPAVKQAASPVLLAGLEQAAELDGILAREAARLEAGGIVPGVGVGEGATLVFLDGPLGRDRLVLHQRGFQTRRGGQSVSLAELRSIAAAEPTRLSANVLLRPIVEAAVLPTAAYVAGPGELRYLALAAALYGPLGVDRQLPVPRWSGGLVEPRVTRLLDRYGIGVEALLSDPAGLETRILRRVYPEGTEAAFQALRLAISERYEPVIRAVAAVDPTLERAAASARAKGLHAVQELEKKLAQHARKREATELGQLRRALDSLRPDGKGQERLYGLPGFLARYGPEVLDGLTAHIDAWYAQALDP